MNNLAPAPFPYCGQWLTVNDRLEGFEQPATERGGA